MKHINLSILSPMQVFDENQKLQIFNNLSYLTEFTDYALATGAKPIYCYLNDSNIKNKSTIPSKKYGSIKSLEYLNTDRILFEHEIIADSNSKIYETIYHAYFGTYFLQDGAEVCPSTHGYDECDYNASLSNRLTIPLDDVDFDFARVETLPNGIQRIEYLWMPRDFADEYLQFILENMHINGGFDNVYQNTNDFLIDTEGNIEEIKNNYYEYNGKYYTRIEANHGNCESVAKWIELKPIVWYRHPNDKLLITEKIVTEPLKFLNTLAISSENSSDYDISNYETSVLKFNIDHYITDEILFCTRLCNGLSKKENPAIPTLKRINSSADDQLTLW